MTNRDEVAEFADRIEERRRRGEEWEFQFEIEFMSLTVDEQVELVELLEQRTAHRKEALEAISENVRILQLLFAWREGALSTFEFVERIREAVPDPLARA